MSWSMKRFVYFLEFIYFILTYVYVSSLMLSSKNIYGIRPCYSMKLELTRVCSLNGLV